MSETFDPAKHILVVRDRETGRHVHVEFQEVVRQIAAAPVEAKPVDLSAIHARLSALETKGQPPFDGLSHSVSSAAADIATLNARLSSLETTYGRHSHDYKLSEQQLQIIAAAVLEQMRLAGAKAA